MTFFVLICLMLSLMSYFNLTKDTFHREFSVQVHDFKTPFYHLGVTCEDLGCEDQVVRCLSIGLLFVVIRFTTYAHTAGTLEQNPWIDYAENYPSWQKTITKFAQLLDSHRKNMDKLL